MNLYFDGNNGRRLIANPSTYQDIIKEINIFLDEHKFKSYYTRLWLEKENTELWMDVGSHSEFFVVTDFTDDVFEILQNHKLLKNN